MFRGVRTVGDNARLPVRSNYGGADGIKIRRKILPILFRQSLSKQSLRRGLRSFTFSVRPLGKAEKQPYYAPFCCQRKRIGTRRSFYWAGRAAILRISCAF